MKKPKTWNKLFVFIMAGIAMLLSLVALSQENSILEVLRWGFIFIGAMILLDKVW